MLYQTNTKNNSEQRLFLNEKFSFRILTSFIITILIIGLSPSAYPQSTKWVGTWSTAEQLVETANNPPSPYLSNNTLRQVLRVSIGGDTLRMKFSNEFSTSSTTITEVRIANSLGGGVIDPATEKTLYFNGEKNVTMAANSAVTSDPFQFSVQPRTDLAVTIYFGSTSSSVTGHPGSRTTSYLLSGNQLDDANFSGSVTTDHWYVINTIDVKAPDSAAAVVMLGNSITDGRGSGTNQQNRWPDELSARFQEDVNTMQVTVLNQGIGGNCVLGTCLGPSALSRFNRDVLGQNGVRWLIILEGINDIGGSVGTTVADNLINAYIQMIQTAHANGIFVYGGTLLPMEGSSYYTTDHETSRQKVNDWIRNSGYFDAVIDFDLALRDPADTLALLPAADTGDHLHPNETGHRMMAEAVDLNLFIGRDSLEFSDNSTSIYLETECGTVGSDWDIFSDPQASNEKYVTVKSGTQSLNSAPTTSESHITIPFSIDTAGTFYVYARLNCASYDDDSFWITMDDGTFQMYNGLVTSGWEWKSINSFILGVGDHTLTIAYREDGAKMDKICISNSAVIPIGMGDEAKNICTETGVENSIETLNGYSLEQNYPNPFNPNTTINYSIPQSSFVNLSIYDSVGQLVKILVDENKSQGEYKISFSSVGLSSGVYYYKLTSGNTVLTKKFVVLK